MERVQRLRRRRLADDLVARRDQQRRLAENLERVRSSDKPLVARLLVLLLTAAPLGLGPWVGARCS